MGNKWKTTSLKELGIKLIDCDHKTPKAVEDGIPYIGIPQMDNGRINFDANPRLISEEDFVTWTRKANPKYGDIILSRRCNSGETVYVPKNSKFALGQNLVLLRPEGDRIHPEYLRWAVHGNEWWNEVGKYLNPGAIFESLKCADIPKFKIPEPPKSAQIKIAEVLSAISDKIELNQQTNQTLEEMAQTLFKSWFVDFDPVIDNALAAGSNVSDFPEALQQRALLRQERRKQAQQLAASPKTKSKPLPEDIRSLFPSEFEQTDEPTIGISGWIPKGWKADTLSSLAKFTSARIDGAELTLDNYISTDNMLQNKGGITKATKVPDIKTTPVFKSGDILISNIRPYFQKIWFATSSGGRSNDVLGFEAIEEQGKEYLLNLLYQDAFFDYMMTTSKGSKMPRGDKKAIMDWGVVIPPSELQECFSGKVKNYYQVIPVRNKETEVLTKLRDTLLPKLISGELTIPDSIKTENNVNHQQPKEPLSNHA
jgi:type I restriction enzyme S subunit